jgi:hypothetical protein
MISYKKGYKYQVQRSYQIDTGIIPPKAIDGGYYSLSVTGTLAIFKGFATDGPSGPTVDSPAFFAGAVGHDAGYEMLRKGLLPQGEGYRKLWDQWLRDECRRQGMWKIRATYVYWGVRVGAKASSLPSHQREILTAPAIGWREIKEES